MQKLLEHKEKRPPNIGVSVMLAEARPNVPAWFPNSSKKTFGTGGNKSHQKNITSFLLYARNDDFSTGVCSS